MNRKFLEDMGIDKENIDKIMAENGADINKAKGALENVTLERDKLAEDLKERDKQLSDLGKAAKDNEELTNQIKQLQEDNKAAAEKHAADLRAEQIKGIVERELVASGAKNTKAVKALLTLDNAELDGETVKGLTDQIKKLQESEDSKFLFNTGDGSSKFKGAKPPEGGEKKGNGEKNPWSKEHYNLTEQGRLLREDPELAKHFQSIQ